MIIHNNHDFFLSNGDLWLYLSELWQKRIREQKPENKSVQLRNTLGFLSTAQKQ